MTNQFYIFYWKILLYNLDARSYDRIQHGIIMDLDLVQFYLNMCLFHTFYMGWMRGVSPSLSPWLSYGYSIESACLLIPSPK